MSVINLPDAALDAAYKTLAAEASAGANSNSAANGHAQYGSKLKPLPFRWATDIAELNVDWLWKPFIAYGTFTILEGEEGLGKSFLTTALAAAQATGFPLPGSSERLTPGNVLLLIAEDSAEATIKPRLLSLGADCARVAVMDEPFALDADGVLRLDHLMAEVEPKMVIIDPLFAFTKGNVNNESDTRPIATEIKKLAEKYDCAIIGIRHIGKAKGHGDPRQAGMASIAWRAAARSVLLVGKNPDDANQKALCQTKNNLERIAQIGYGFEICPSPDHTVGEFFWTGESNLTALKMLGTAQDAEERESASAAMEFLRVALQDGAQTAAAIIAAGKANGFTEKQLRTAREKLRIVPRKKGGWFGKIAGAGWEWSLPEDAHNSDAGHLQANPPKEKVYRYTRAEDAHAERNGHLQPEAGGAAEDARANPAGHLQPNTAANINQNGGATEDAQAAEKGHLQPRGKLFETATEKPQPAPAADKAKFCDECKKPVKSYSELCPHCGNSPSPF